LITKLFEPIRVGPMELSNRVVMTAMHMNYTPNGHVSEQLTNFYTARARGGVGLMIIGGAEIDDEASGMDTFLSIKDDKFIPGLKSFADAIHNEGGKVAVQLYMAGAYSFASLKGLPVFAPSSYVSAFSRQQTTPMTLEDIERVQDDFTQATRRAKEAGFDAVEVLASAGYLISQFLSPKTNKRDDDYGGPLVNRMRFGREVVEKVRKEAGSNMAVLVRIAGNDFVPDSHTNTEAKVFAKTCQDAGADCLNVTGGWHESRVPQITMDLPQAGYVYLAQGIKDSCDIPVIGCNRINDPIVAEYVLQEGIADMVGVARGHIADPEFVNKTKAGKIDEIRRCVACNQRCFDYVFMLRPVGCMVNPRAGREGETELVSTETPKKIVVVGAGPAGCEFAVSATQRGHKVILCDKEEYLGGQVHWFAQATRKPEYLNIFKYYGAIIAKHQIDWRPGVEVTKDFLIKENPDLVVVATGAAPFKPPVPSVDLPHVVQAWDVLQGKVTTGENVVIVGGGLTGLETAVFLAAKGTISPEQLYFLTLHQAETPDVLRDLLTKGVKNVTVIEMAGKMGKDMGPSNRWVLLKDLAARGVKLVTNATMKEIQERDIVYTNVEDQDIRIPADTVVLAMGSRSENSIADELKDLGVDIIVIGDANKVGKIGDAVEAGFNLAMQV
jgi:2,4-dienoyl-CoA reductase (NADPH2)